MRYYKKELPDENEYVLVKLKRITEHNFAIVELLEYDNIEGMILFSEIHHRKINIDKLFKNNIQICIVTDVDIEKKYVNVSYKKVLDEERIFYTNSIVELDKLISIFKDMQILYDNHTNTKTQIIYEKIMWNLLDSYTCKKDFFTNLGIIYRNILENPIQILSEIDISVDYKISCSENIKKRVKYTDIQGALYFDLLIFENNAANLIKNILSTTEKWKYECISSPKYRIIATSDNKNDMDKIIINAKSELQKKLNNIDCLFKIDETWTTIKERTYTIKPLFIH